MLEEEKEEEEEEAEEGGSRLRGTIHHHSPFPLVMNERDTAKYSNGRGSTDSLDGNNRQEEQGEETLSRAKSRLTRRYELHAIERKRVRERES